MTTDLGTLSDPDLLVWEDDGAGALPWFHRGLSRGTELTDLLCDFNDVVAEVARAADRTGGLLARMPELLDLLDRIERTDEAGERQNVLLICRDLRGTFDGFHLGGDAGEPGDPGAGADHGADGEGEADQWDSPVSVSWLDTGSGYVPRIEVPAEAAPGLDGELVEAITGFNDQVGVIVADAAAKRAEVYDHFADKGDQWRLQWSTELRNRAAAGGAAVFVAPVVELIDQWWDEHVVASQHDRATRLSATLVIHQIESTRFGSTFRLKLGSLEALTDELAGAGLGDLAARAAAEAPLALALPNRPFPAQGPGYELVVQVSDEAKGYVLSVVPDLAHFTDASGPALSALRTADAVCCVMVCGSVVLFSEGPDFAEYDDGALAIFRILRRLAFSSTPLPLPPLSAQVGTVRRVHRTGPRRDYFEVSLAEGDDATDYAWIAHELMTRLHRESRHLA